MPQLLPVSGLLARIERNWPEMAQQLLPAVPYLYRARDLLFEDLQDSLEPAGLLPADLDVLAALRVQPEPHELTPTALYQALFLSSGGLTKILGRLQQAELIERHANPLDRRSRLVRLSAQGRQRLDALVGTLGEHERRFLSPLDPGEQAELARLLEKLVSLGET